MKKYILLLSMSFIAAASYSQVGINTDDPKAVLHVEGDVILRNAPVSQDYSALPLVQTPDGTIGHTPVIAARHCLIQGYSTQRIGDINSGDPQLVTWDIDTDKVISNNLVTMNNDNTFTFNENVICEISGFVNYCPRVYSANNDLNSTSREQVLAALNVSIQYKPKGSGEWQPFSIKRESWFAYQSIRYYKTVEVPGAVQQFHAGDQIRMVVARPSEGNSYYIGRKHNTESTGYNIAADNGNVFSKGIKIIAL